MKTAKPAVSKSNKIEPCSDSFSITMKSTTNNWAKALLSLSAVALVAFQGHSQITVKVDANKNWAGYMNWFSTNNGYVGGGAWGIDALRAKFSPAKSNATRVVLQINTNTYAPGTANPPDANYWNLPDGTPNKHLEANFYVDVGTSFAGNDVTFTGTVESNTLPAGWTCEAVIKQFGGGYSYVGDTRAALVTGSPFSVTRTIPAGNICQYGFLMYGPNTAPNSPASLEAVSIVVETPNPAIVTDPANQRAVLGGTATFSAQGVGSPTPAYYWKRYGTNLLNGAKFSGVNTPTLTVNNVQLADAATNYILMVSNVVGTATSQPAKLKVLTAAEYANSLDNPSFEQNYDAVNAPGIVPEPWVNFTGSALWSTDLFNFASPIDGTNVVQVYTGGQYSGFYQDVPASPGDIFTGDCWIYVSSLDPLTAPTHEAFAEVQFRQGAANPITMYQSAVITAASPLDTWMHLQITNGIAAGYAAITSSNATYLIAPPGTDKVRVQVTVHAEGGGSGSVFADSLRLAKKNPVTVTATTSGGNITLSWLTQALTDYQVVYKDDLSNPTWTPIGGLVAGDGTVKTASFAIGAGKRFYNVLTK